MNNFELAAGVKQIAETHRTLYVMGCFGAPLTKANKERYKNNCAYNRTDARRRMIDGATADTFGFDCVCLIKGVLWGWNGDENALYGGAKYESNGVPDVGANAMIGLCRDVSSDFSAVEIGEALWLSGHIGVYIGGGLAVECTPAWENRVQITAVENMGEKKGYPSRRWTKHGRLPWVTYLPAGDADLDGHVTAADARTALRAAARLETLPAAGKIAADLDGDGKVTAADARQILRKSVEER